MNTRLNTLERDVLRRMIDELDCMEGRDGYVSELAFSLFEVANRDGTLTYSAEEAKQWIIEHFHDLADVVEEIKCEWDITPNPFMDPEAFMVQVVLYLAGNLVYDSDDLKNYLQGRDDVTYDEEVMSLLSQEWEEALSE